MKILVTGATGFVGFHTAKVLLAAGYTVRLGARSEAKLKQVFSDGELAQCEHCVLQITDRDSVKSAVRGCDAVVHTAALVSMEEADRELMFATNVDGTRYVVEEAAAAGVGRLVYVSSASVFFQPGIGHYDENTAYVNTQQGYALSKITADRWVKQQMAAGQPIAICYPTGIVGPDDPGMSECNNSFRYFLDKSFVDTESGMQLIDVRDLARVLAMFVENDICDSYLIAGRFMHWPELGDALQSVLAAKLPRVKLSGSLLRSVSSVSDMLRRFIPFDTIFTRDAMEMATLAPAASTEKFAQQFDFEFTPVEKSLADMVAWMQREGHISSKWLETSDT